MYTDDKPVRHKRNKKSQRKKFFTTPVPSKRRKRSRNENEFNNIQSLETMHSVLLIIIGLIFFMNPDYNQTIISIIIGILMILLALLNIFNKQSSLNPLYKFSKIEGVINILLGLLTLLSAILPSLKIYVLLGLWYIFLSIVEGYITIQLKIIEDQSWLVHAISVLLTIFMAIVIMINPFKKLQLALVIGIFLILYGLLNASTCQLRKQRSSIILEHL